MTPVTVSKAAMRLLHIFRERPDNYSIASLAHDVGTSKTGIERALAELEQHRIINIREEDLK